jgi:hypothetical protein
VVNAERVCADKPSNPCVFVFCVGGKMIKGLGTTIISYVFLFIVILFVKGANHD